MTVAFKYSDCGIKSFADRVCAIGLGLMLLGGFVPLGAEGAKLQPSGPQPPASQVVPPPSLMDLATWEGEGQGMPDMVACRRLQRDRTCRVVKGWHFKVGHGAYVLSGRIADVWMADQIVGFLFEGEGSWTYVSEDRTEFKAAAYNLGTHLGKDVDASGTVLSIPEQIDGGLFLFANREVPVAPAASEGATGEFRADRAKKLIEVRAPDSIQDLSMRIRKVPGQGLDTPYFRIYTLRKKQAWLHGVDTSQAETLQAFQRSAEVSGWLLVSRQTVQGDHKNPVLPRFLLSHVDLKVDLKKNPKNGSPSGLQVEATLAETITALTPGLRILDMRLRNQTGAMPGEDADGGGRPSQPCKIRRIVDATGEPLPFEHSDGGLLIAIPPAQVGQEILLKIELEGALLEPVTPKVWADARASEWMLGGAWFPIPANPMAELFTLNARIRTPMGYTTLLSGGGSVRRTRVGDGMVLESKVENLTRSLHCLLKGASMFEEQQDTVFVRCFGAGSPGGEWELLQRVPGQVRIIEKALGPFPVPELSFFLNDKVPPFAQPMRDKLLGCVAVSRVGQRESAIALLEALAQPYWSHVLKPQSPKDLWMLEALPAYSAAMLASLAGGDVAAFERQIQEWTRESEKTVHLGSLASAHRLVPRAYALDGDRVLSFSRSRGCCLLSVIHRELGDAGMLTFLRTVLATASYQPMNSFQFLSLLNQSTGRDFQALFDASVWGNAVPSKALVPVRAVVRKAP